MSEDHYNEYIGKPFIAFSVVAAFIFWLVFTYLLTPFVPTETLPWVYIWSGFTATPLTGVFFMSLHMFRLVAVENSRAKQQRS